MEIVAIIPVKSFDEAKSRLSVLLDREQRRELSRLMLQDTLKTLSHCRELRRIIVVSSDPLAKEITQNLGLECLVQSEDNGVSNAVKYADTFLKNSGGNCISITIPCDLLLLRSKVIDHVCKSIPRRGACIIICPSYKYDGTNLLARSPFDVIEDTRYDNDSFRGHIEASMEARAYTKILQPRSLMIDLDTPEDLRLILIKDSLANRSILYLRQVGRFQLTPASRWDILKREAKTRTNANNGPATTKCTPASVRNHADK